MTEFAPQFRWRPVQSESPALAQDGWITLTDVTVPVMIRAKAAHRPSRRARRVLIALIDGTIRVSAANMAGCKAQVEDLVRRRFSEP